MANLSECNHFSPILYSVDLRRLEASPATALERLFPKGAIPRFFSNEVRETRETFLSATGSDCGLANETSSLHGAEIGGAFRVREG